SSTSSPTLLNDSQTAMWDWRSASSGIPSRTSEPDSKQSATTRFPETHETDETCWRTRGAYHATPDIRCQVDRNDDCRYHYITKGVVHIAQVVSHMNEPRSAVADRGRLRLGWGHESPKGFVRHRGHLPDFRRFQLTSPRN